MTQDEARRTVTTYAIGDIHGRRDLIEALLAAIAAETRDVQVVFLGDLIDRGPESMRVLDVVAAHLEANPRSRLILGNHDWFLRQLLSGELSPESHAHWIGRLGGGTALSSYGIETLPVTQEEARARVTEARPEHAALLDRALYSFAQDGLFFTHAGVRPGIALDRQVPHDLMNIRDDFLSSTEDFGAIVVHGHSPTPARQPEVHANRIALDTQAFATGRLTAAAFDGGTLSHFLCTETDDNGVIQVERRGLSG